MGLLLLMGDSEINPRSLFANNEPGVWFDPAGNDGASQSKIDSGLTGSAFISAYPTHSLYTNTTGTSPAIYPGDLVALQIDQSRGGLGNLGAELVTNGGFNADSDWTKGTGWTISGGKADYSTGGGILEQDIGLVAGRLYRIQATLTASAPITYRIYCGHSSITLNQAISTSGTYTFLLFAQGSNSRIGFSGGSTGSSYSIDNISVREIPGTHRYATTDANRPKLARIPEGGRRNLLTYSETMATQNVTVTAAQHTLSFRGTGTVTLSGVSTAGPLAGTGASDIVSLTFTPTAGTLTLTVAGTVELAQLELGASRSNYQKVTLTEDVTETGKRDCWGLWYQGAQSMITPSVDFSGTDKMTVWAGVRKLSDAARGTVTELTATVASNNGGFHLTAPNAASDTFAFESKGTTLTDAVSTGVAAPATRVLCGIGDISGDIATLRLNGVQADSDTGDQGSGNYANAALYFGRRNNASLPFSGYDFGTIIRGAATTDSTIRAIEKFLAQRAGITI